MSFEENFLYPLYLLLIGGGLTGVLIPFFNQQHELKQKRIDRDREDHAMELGIKLEIIKNISKAWSIAILRIYLLSEKINHKENNVESTLESKEFLEYAQVVGITGSLIRAYFKDVKLGGEWRDLHDNLTRLWGFYDNITIKKSPGNSHDFEIIKNYFGKDIGIDWDEFKSGKVDVQLFGKLNVAFLNIRDELMDKILKKEINTSKKSEK